MSFPIAPVDGEVYQRYIYNSTTAAWDKNEAASESGSNSNGNWLKLSDGTLIQWGFTANIGTNLSANAVANTTGTVYHSASQTQQFPIAFNNNNAVITYNAGQGAYPSTYYTHSVSTTQFSWYVWTTKAGDAMSAGCPWQAIGRWK